MTQEDIKKDRRLRVIALNYATNNYGEEATRTTQEKLVDAEAYYQFLKGAASDVE